MTEQAKKEGSAKWNPVIKKVQVTVLLSESNGRFCDMSNDKTGWLRVVGSLNKSTGLLYTKGMLATKIANMKAQFMEFEKYANQIGFGMDSNGMVTGSPASLTTYYASHPIAKTYRRGANCGEIGVRRGKHDVVSACICVGVGVKTRRPVVSTGRKKLQILFPYFN